MASQLGFVRRRQTGSTLNMIQAKIEGGAVAEGSVSAAASVGDPDRADSGDDSVNGIVGRLGSVANVSAVVGGRLSAINAVLGPVPDDGKPALLAKVGVIRANCSAALATLALIQDKIG